MSKTVVLDIGHGVNTFPTHGKGVRRNGVGYAEHNFNSILALKIKPLLEKSGVKVVFGQEPYEQDVPLMTRTNGYSKLSPRADAIVSLHANANANTGVSGRCAFYWHTSSRAKLLAENIIAEIKEKGYSTHGNGLHASMRGSWTNLHMTRLPAEWSRPVPSVLIEYGFMTNFSGDFHLIFGDRQSEYTDDMAVATAKALCKFIGVTYKGGKPVSVPATPPNNVDPTEGKVYIVKPGDTLWGIAQAHGVSVEDLRKMNGLDDNIINPGQELTVKVESDKKDEVIITIPDTYTVKPGDTLGEISFEFGLKLDDLVKWNRISNPNVVNVGAVLRLKENVTVTTPKPNPVVTKPRFVEGERVQISNTAQRYATGQRIPASVKGRVDTIHSVGSDRVLLTDIYSWVLKTDIVGNDKPTYEILDEDGVWGRKTTKRLQEVLGTPADGIISGQVRNPITQNIGGVNFGSGGSMMVREMQRRLGVKADGYIGAITVRALQRRMGTNVTGGLSARGSLVATALQRRLNENRF